MQIDLRNLSFAYDDALVLRNVELDVRSGECVALVGPNGSGKSTLLRLVSGVHRPASGQIKLDGRSLLAFSPRQLARRLAMVDQERTIAFEFTVREVVAMGRIPHRARFAAEASEDRRAIERAMDLADVRPLSGRSIRALSGGERQRVFLAMALAQEPEVLLLDEPTTHLDLGHQIAFMAIVRGRADEGMAVLLSIHDLTLAARASDRIALLSEGRILRTGSPRSVLTRENLQEVFGVDVVVGVDPEEDLLYVLPTLRSEGRSVSDGKPSILT